MSDKANSGDLALVARIFGETHGYRLNIAAMFVISLLATPLALLGPVPLKIAIDSVLGSEPVPSFLAPLLPGWFEASGFRILLYVAFLQIAIVLLSQIQSMSQTLLQTYTGEKLTLRFRSKLLGHAQRLSFSFHDARGTADSIYRIQWDAPAIQHVAISGLNPFVTSSVTLVAMIYIVLRIDVQLALVALAVSPFLFGAARAFRLRMRPKYRQPIVWHIMKYYSQFGHDEFVLALGHLGREIKEYFLNFDTMFSDLTVSLGPEPSVEVHRNGNAEDWTVTLAETGQSTMTAGRVRRITRYITGDNFMLTYGDGVSDVDLAALEAYHVEHGKLITITGVIPPGRFGELHVDDGQVTRMEEKPEIGHHRHINGGFMIVNRGFIDAYLEDVDDDMPLEREPMERAAKDGEMMMWAHEGFWQPMDTPPVQGSWVS